MCGLACFSSEGAPVSKTAVTLIDIEVDRNSESTGNVVTGSTADKTFVSPI
jgi:hypothetical protein